MNITYDDMKKCVTYLVLEDADTYSGTDDDAMVVWVHKDDAEIINDEGSINEVLSGSYEDQFGDSTVGAIRARATAVKVKDLIQFWMDNGGYKSPAQM